MDQVSTGYLADVARDPNQALNVLSKNYTNKSKAINFYETVSFENKAYIQSKSAKSTYVNDPTDRHAYLQHRSEET